MLGSSVKTGSIHCWKKKKKKKKKRIPVWTNENASLVNDEKTSIHQTPNTIFTDDKVARAH